MKLLKRNIDFTISWKTRKTQPIEIWDEKKNQFFDTTVAGTQTFSILSDSAQMCSCLYRLQEKLHFQFTFFTYVTDDGHEATFFYPLESKHLSHNLISDALIENRTCRLLMLQFFQTESQTYNEDLQNFHYELTYIIFNQERLLASKLIKLHWWVGGQESCYTEVFIMKRGLRFEMIFCIL